MKKILTLNLIIMLLTALTPYVSAVPSDSEENYGTGLIWDSPDIIEGAYTEFPPTEDALPASVDLTDSFPAPGNQGSQNSCVAWAISYALMSHQEQVKRDWGLDTDEHLFSPSYIYNQINGGNNKGTTLPAAMKILVQQGVCTLAAFPYKASDYTTQPTAEQTAEALNYRIHNYSVIHGTDSIKRRLADGDGVIVGIEVFPDFRSLSPANPVYDTEDGTASGAHTVCLIGYDDGKRAFKFINSWGTTWGIDGYGWISYDLLKNPDISHYGTAAGYVMEPRGIDERFEGYFDYTVTADGNAKLCNYFGSNPYITVPDTLGGYPVTEIGDKAFIGDLYLGGSPLKSIALPDSITNIGTEAFKNCASLDRIRIPDNVTAIGSRAFEGCVSLTSAIVPDSVTHIGDKAFHWIKSSSAGALPLPNLTIKCSENSYAHQYAIDNDLKFEIMDFNARMIIPNNLSNDANVSIGCIELTHDPDGSCKLNVYYIPVMSEMPMIYLAVYDENKLTKVYVSEDGEELNNLNEKDLTNCKIFIWTHNMQPCIESIRGDITAYPKFY